MQQEVRQELLAYINDSSTEAFLRLQRAVAASPEYNPYDRESLRLAEALIDDGKYEEAVAQFSSIMANWITSVRAHESLAFAYHKLGRTQAAEMEVDLAALLREGLLATGDGSEARPYHVLRTTDEYDVFHRLGKTRQSQSLIENGDQRLDCHHCEDGTTVWFDVTVPLGYLDRHLR